MCLLKYGRYINTELCLNETLAALLLSTLPTDIYETSKKLWTLETVELFINWIREYYITGDELSDTEVSDYLSYIGVYITVYNLIYYPRRIQDDISNYHNYNYLSKCRIIFDNNYFNDIYI